MPRTSGYSIRLGDDGDNEDDDNSNNNNNNNNNLQTAPNCRTLPETISRFARGEIVSLLASFSLPPPPFPPTPLPPSSAQPPHPPEPSALPPTFGVL